MGWQSCRKYADGKEIVLFPDVSFLSVLQDGGGFSRTKMASRTMLDDVSAIYPYHLAGYFKKLDVKPFYALSPVKLPSVMDKFLAKYGKLEMKGLSLRDLGRRVELRFQQAAIHEPGRSEEDGRGTTGGAGFLFERNGFRRQRLYAALRRQRRQRPA